jgi:hypothetical protein
MVSHTKGKAELRVFENRVLRRIFGPKRHEVTEWRKLHNQELHNLHLSPNIIRQIKSTKIRLDGHVAYMEEEKCTRFWWQNPKEDHSDDQSVDGRLG